MVFKIAFLFLIASEIFHPEYWQDFFKGHEQQYSIYIHSKNIMPEAAYLKSSEIVSKIPTTWANTMSAQLELLREALKDPGNQKFIFISESTIPLQNFYFVYKQLTKSPKSQFWFTQNPFLHEIERNLNPIPSDKQYFNFQWIVLNRFHAQLLVNAQYYQSIIMKYQCDNEHYPSTVLAHYNQLHKVIPHDTTFVVWPVEHGPHPITFTLNTQLEFDIVKQGIKQGYFFARKFAPNIQLNVLDPYLGYRASFDFHKYQELLSSENIVLLQPINPKPCKKCGMLPLVEQNIFPSD